MAINSDDVVRFFQQGKPRKYKATQSTGDALFFHGNKIAEYRSDGLYISNGGYEGNKGETGSKTTKERLNTLDGVYISQKNYKWFLSGVEWDGEWIKVEGAIVPAIDKSKAGDVFSAQLRYIHTDGWRGYEEPIYAVVGANDTGMYSDSPCPSNVREEELKAIANVLNSAGIPTKEVVTQSSNVFCVHVYLIAKIKQVQQARDIVKHYLENTETRLSYLVS